MDITFAFWASPSETPLFIRYFHIFLRLQKMFYEKMVVKLTYGRTGYLYGVVVKLLDCQFFVSEFELQSCY